MVSIPSYTVLQMSTCFVGVGLCFLTSLSPSDFPQNITFKHCDGMEEECGENGELPVVRGSRNDTMAAFE